MVLAGLALSCLLYKRVLEHPKRPFQVNALLGGNAISLTLAPCIGLALRHLQTVSGDSFRIMCIGDSCIFLQGSGCLVYPLVQHYIFRAIRSG
jgi:hypothetical protein